MLTRSSDLKIKKKENATQYHKLFSIIKKIYNCEPINNEEMNVPFINGYTSELIIKTLKWLFIEQDIRYWNYSGRDMLWNAIKGI